MPQVSLILCTSQAAADADETKHVLEFAAMASEVKTAAMPLRLSNVCATHHNTWQRCCRAAGWPIDCRKTSGSGCEAPVQTPSAMRQN